MSIKKTVISTVITLILAVQTISAAEKTANANDVLGDPGTHVRADDIPAGPTGYSYIPGSAAAHDSIAASTYSKSAKFALKLKAGFSRSCGSLDVYTDITKNITNQLKDQVNKIEALVKTFPALIAQSAVEYAMAKINPILNNLFTKKLDEYIELFELNMMACEDVKSELARNPDASVFAKLIRMSTADEWDFVLSEGKFSNSRDSKKEIEEDGRKKGLPMADGKKYGGEDTPPINFLQSLSEAGINMLVGRDNVDDWGKAFTSEEKLTNPIAKEFAKPEEIMKFLEDIYGSVDFRISEKDEMANQGVNSKPGTGYQRAYSEIRNEYLKQIKAYVYQSIDKKQFADNTGLLIRPIAIQDLRHAEEYDRATRIEQMAKEHAVDTMNRKLSMAANALSVGIKAPDLVKSKLYSEAVKKHKSLYYQILDDQASLSRLKY